MPIGPGRRVAGLGDVAVVVVVHVVVDEHPARMGVRDRAGAAVRAGAVLGRRRVAGDLGVGVDAVLVVVELRVLDDDGSARVGSRVAEGVVLHPGVVDGDVAHLDGRRRRTCPSRSCWSRRSGSSRPALRRWTRRCRTARPCPRCRSRWWCRSGRCRCSRSGRSCPSRRRRSTRSRCPSRPHRPGSCTRSGSRCSRRSPSRRRSRCGPGPCRRRPGRGSGTAGRSCTAVGAPALVPSTMTVLRFIPRMCRSDVCTTTPPWSPVPKLRGGGDVGVVGLVVVARSDEDPVTGLRRVDRGLDGRYCPALPWYVPTSSTAGDEPEDEQAASTAPVRSAAARTTPPRAHRRTCHAVPPQSSPRAGGGREGPGRPATGWQKLLPDPPPGGHPSWNLSDRGPVYSSQARRP